MVTKQEQLEWLAVQWREWTHSRSQVFMSKHIIGNFVSMTNDSHIILKEEWRKERDKLMSNMYLTKVMSLDEAIDHATEKAIELKGVCSENHEQLAKWLVDYKKLKGEVEMKTVQPEEVKMEEKYNFQEWCKEILPVVQAGAEGKEIEYKSNGSEFWYSFNTADYDCISFTTEEEYRIKPKTIKVNGFDVLEPLNQETSGGNSFYIACPTMVTLFIQHNAVLSSDLWFKRGLVHATKEAAIAHAKAMLGIDPNKE